MTITGPSFQIVVGNYIFMGLFILGMFWIVFRH